MPGCLLCVFSFSNASVEFESSALYFDTVEENILGGGVFVQSNIIGSVW